MTFRIIALGLALAFSRPADAVRVVSPWMYPTQRGFDLLPLERSQPIIVGDIVYVARMSGQILAFQRNDGYLLWEKKLPAGVEGSLSYFRSKLYVGDLAGNFYSLNARDGSEIWQFKISGEWLSPAVATRDTVVVLSGNGEVYALAEATGKEVWHFSHPGDEKMSIRGNATPVVFGSDVYVGFSDGFFASLSVSDGQTHWVKRLRTRDRFYDIDSTPYVDEKSVTVATFDGRVFQLGRLTGETSWVFDQGSYGGFLAENDMIYFSGLDGRFHALDRAFGSERWSVPLDGKVGQTPVRIDKYLVVTTVGDPVYIIDPEKKKAVLDFPLGSGSLAPAAPHLDGWFYCLSNYGNVFAFKLDDAHAGRTAGVLRSPSATSARN